MARAKKEAALTPEERLQAALVPDWEWPYKLPENWCWTRHNSIMDIVGGAQPEKAFFIREPKEGYVQLYQTRDYGENPVPVYIPQKYATKTTDEGDILLARYGGSLGKVFRAHKGAYNVALAKVIILYPEVVDDEFLYLYYYSHFYQNFCIKAGYGRSAQAGFNKSDLNELLVPLPPFIEQQRIVDRTESLFAKLDEAKEKAQAVVDSFETCKAAILHKAFTGELTAKWREDHDVGMESWEKRLLSTVSSLQTGLMKGKKYSGKTVELPYLRVANVQDGFLRLDEIKKIDVEEKAISRYSLAVGDVLFTEGGDFDKLGRGTVWEVQIKNCLHQNHIFVVRPNPEVLNPYFLSYQAGSRYGKAYFLSCSKQTTNLASINSTQLKNFPVLIPSIAEQEMIIKLINSFLEKELHAKEVAEAVLDQIDLMKKSILARAFRGELGTNDPTEESAVELLKKVFQKE